MCTVIIPPECWSHSCTGSVLTSRDKLRFFQCFFCLTVSHCLSFLTDHFPVNAWAISWFVLLHNHTFKTPQHSSQAVQTISSTFLSFLCPPSTETSCLFYQERNTDHIPWATQTHFSSLSFLFQTNSFHCISLKFLQKHTCNTRVYNFIKETVRRV